MQVHLSRLVLVSGIFTTIMTAQPVVTVINSLSEVRIFPSTSSEFASAASAQGVDALLPTLGVENLPLIVALRNDSGQAIDSMRIVWQIHNKDGSTYPRIALHGPMAADAAVLDAPEQLGRALTALKPQVGTGLSSRRGPSPALVKNYQDAAEVTVSIDSATLASGLFVGADSFNFFPRLVEEAAGRKKFFTDFSGLQSNPRLEEILTARKSAAESNKQTSPGIAGLNLAALAESMLCQEALMRIRMGTLGPWIAQQNTQLASKPPLHR